MLLFGGAEGSGAVSRTLSPHFLHLLVVTFPAAAGVTEGVRPEGSTAGHLTPAPCSGGVTPEPRDRHRVQRALDPTRGAAPHAGRAQPALGTARGTAGDVTRRSQRPPLFNGAEGARSVFTRRALR